MNTHLLRYIVYLPLELAVIIFLMIVQVFLLHTFGRKELSIKHLAQVTTLQAFQLEGALKFTALKATGKAVVRSVHLCS